MATLQQSLASAQTSAALARSPVSTHTRSAVTASVRCPSTALALRSGQPRTDCPSPSPPSSSPFPSSSTSCRVASVDGASQPDSPPPPSTPPSPPEITLRFVSPSKQSGEDEDEAVVTLPSGTKNLRRAMLDAKVPLYDMYGSFMNCGGGGSCGTCLVDVREGGELLSGRTDAEERFLKKRPASWRLACQTIVGDKSNAGTVVLETKPQSRKK